MSRLRPLRLALPLALLAVGAGVTLGGCGSAPTLPPEELDLDGGVDALGGDGASTIDSRPADDSSTTVDDSGTFSETAVDPDTGAVDTGTVVADTGTVVIDTGTAVTDTGTVLTDTGTVVTDTGTVVTDTGTVVIDTGTVVVDTGTVVTDTGTTCALVSDNKFYVDPVAGNDTTGSGISTCPVKTITRAMALINGRVGGAAVGTQVLLRNNTSAATGETFPIIVPSNVLVRSELTTAIRTVEVATARTGFSLANDYSGLSYLAIDGKGVAYAGVAASGASTSTNTGLLSVTVTGMRNDGIYVEAGGLRIGAGVRSYSNGTSPTSGGLGSGLHVRGGSAVIQVNAGEATTSFDLNSANGILVDGSGFVTATGKPDLTGFPATIPPAVNTGAGTVVVKQNKAAGIGITQSGATTPGVNALTGLVVWKNEGNGIRVYAGSRLTLRDTVSAQNARNGFEVSPSSTTTSVTGIDLGGDAFGRNMFAANSYAGVCIDNFGGNTVALSAKGNLFGTKSCAVVPAPMPAPVLLSAAGNFDCSGVGPLDVSAARGGGGAAPTKVSVLLSNCQDVSWP